MNANSLFFYLDMQKFLIKRTRIKQNLISEANGIASGDREHSKYKRVDLDNLEADPRLRKSIYDYHPNERDEIQQPYLLRGPCQPREHHFPQKEKMKWKALFSARMV